ncbi:MAG: TetR/AcrR family transcriptional regulator [Polyangiaceae bacterium]
MSTRDSKIPRKLPTQERSKETVKALLDATDSLLATIPVSALTLTDIAKKSGITQGSIYQYFPTKEAILAAWEEREWARISNVVAGTIGKVIEEAPPIEDAVRRIVRVTTELVADHARVYTDTGMPDFLSRSDERQRVVAGVVDMIAGAITNSPVRASFRVADPVRAARIVVRVLLTVPPVANQAKTDAERARILVDIEDIVVTYLLGRPLSEDA